MNEALFAYVDGELSPERVTEVERAIMRNPEIRARYDAINAVDDALKRIADPENAPRPQANPSGRSWRGVALWGALAASIVVVGVLIVRSGAPSAPGFTPRAPSERVVSARDDYARIAFAFEPHVVCDTPEKFDAYTLSCFNEPISADFGSPVTFVGWRGYGGSYDEEARAPTRRVLLAQSASGSKVVVYFIPDGLSGPELDLDPELTAHESRIGSVRLIEVSPEPDPVVIPALSGV